MTPEEMMANPDMINPALTGIMAGLGVAYVVVLALLYVYFAISLQIIATKTATGNAWMAWVPIVNIFLMLMAAKKPLWWFILMLIPLVNIIMLILVWMEIAKNRGKPAWVGVLMIVPIVGLFVPGYLAFSK